MVVTLNAVFKRHGPICHYIFRYVFLNLYYVPGHEILVLITYAQIHLINAHKAKIKKKTIYRLTLYKITGET